MAYPFTKPQVGLNGFFRDGNYEDPDRLVGQILNFQNTLQTVVFAATVTPDLSLGLKITCTLTNNVAIANPVQDPLVGTEVTFLWLQDGTGTRTITYSGTKWKTVGVAAVTTTASTYTIDRFIFDGTNYRITTRVTAQTA